ncbi:hypothetical protein [Paenibacillus xylaniclasticus]|uniref:hypothetical protein n=1 Tax=Paenibacillus xylaniclasticus TaxID=588083 RepID=UPI0017557D47|nr:MULTISPECIES: hypothetical protein [Paenibacillus]GFN33248.1 hypothetical protein PCURB6_35080 [Paenibacillus curdlanolyticus]
MKRLAVVLMMLTAAAGAITLVHEGRTAVTTAKVTDEHIEGQDAKHEALTKDSDLDGNHRHLDDSLGSKEHPGMDMQREAKFQAVLAAAGDGLKAGQDSEITIRIQDAAGVPVTKFALLHEKLLHLIIVSEDLRDFRHIHPGYDGSGVFRVVTQFADGGRYKWFADFVPNGNESVTRSGWLTVDGKPVYDAPALQADASLIQQVEGTEVELVMGEAKAGEPTQLHFRFRDVESGKEADGMQSYLGAAGHVVIVSSDMEQYLHVHPADSQVEAEAEADFSTVFPTSGLYKIWGQFQRDGRVLTVPFVVKVS